MLSILDPEPKRVWYYFNEICKIPHGSGNEAGLRSYIIDIAKRLGLEYKADEHGNLVVRKPASNSKSSKIIVLQGHLDMVCEAEKNKKYDPIKDPIEPYVDGEWLKAKGTSLGADNAVAIAMALAILELKDIVHGPLECLMTVEEEAGLIGASELSLDMLKGKTLINMDSEEDTTFYVGCAGNKRLTYKLPYKQIFAPTGYIGLQISISGLKGGHSGSEINQQRGNSNKMLGRMLGEFKKKHDLLLSSFDGGTKPNVIPSSASTVVAIKEENKGDVERIVKEFIPLFKNELAKSDPAFKIDVTETKLDNVIEKEASDKIVNFINAGPNGVLQMSLDIPGLVQTSVNLARIKTEKDHCLFSLSIRSSVDSEGYAAREQYTALADLIGAQLFSLIEYFGWQPNLDSAILRLCKKVYKEMFSRDPRITAIHGGLECGVIGSKYPGMEAISYGPELHDVHSPNEKLNIKSAQNFYKFIIRLLEELAKE